MKLIVDIDDELVETAKFAVQLDMADEYAKSIANGIPLPKGHGRLIILSEDAVKSEQTPLSFSCQKWISEVGLSNATVTIIEADKAERSDKG